MDIRDPHLGPGKIWKGCDDTKEDLPEIDYLHLAFDKPMEGLTVPVCFKLTSYYIDKIDNGFIIYYKIDPEEPSRKRFVPDTESLARFIDQHTDKS